MLDRPERAAIVRRTTDAQDARRLVICAVEGTMRCDCRVPAGFRDLAASFSAAELRAIARFLDDAARTRRDQAALLRDASKKTPRV
jgi:hypothetical protein